MSGDSQTEKRKEAGRNGADEIEQLAEIDLRELTVKERTFIKGMLQGLSPRKAALEAGYGNSSYLKAFDSDRVKASIETLMRAAGLGTRELLELHHDLLHATKVTAGRIDGESPVNEVPDWSSRARGLELAYRLTGMFSEQATGAVQETHEQMLERLRNQSGNDHHTQS